MTRQRNGVHPPTEFSDWLRKQPSLDSSPRYGFNTTNIDYVWQNYMRNKYMLIEEKRYCIAHKNAFTRAQYSLYKILDMALRTSNGYCGFHLIEFENTNPEDGLIWIDRSQRTKEELINFLEFRSILPSYLLNKSYNDIK